MFDLEQSITDWRQQMLDAGVKTPMPLEELESHLREEIERQMKSGLSEQELFNSAVQKIGQAGLLKMEFKKVDGLPGWFGDNSFTRINRILGSLWLAQGLWLFPQTLPILFSPNKWPSLAFFKIGFLALLELAGIVGGVFLVRDAKLGCNVIRIVALTNLACLVSDILRGGSSSALGYFFTLLDLMTLWILFSPRYRIPRVAR